MFRIQRPFMILIFLSVGLSACTTATPISTATSQIIPTTTSTPPAITATETLASTTPEPTATPEPVVVQTEVTFDLTNGGTLSMPGFLANKPEGELTEEEKIKLLEMAFVYIVKDGIDWTITKAVPWNDVPQKVKDDVLKLNPIVGILHIGGSTVPYNMEGKGDVFMLGFSSVPYSGVEGTLLKYRTDEGGYGAVYVQMEVDEVLAFLRENMVNIPPKP